MNAKLIIMVLAALLSGCAAQHDNSVVRPSHATKQEAVSKPLKVAKMDDQGYFDPVKSGWKEIKETPEQIEMDSLRSVATEAIQKCTNGNPYCMVTLLEEKWVPTARYPNFASIFVQKVLQIAQTAKSPQEAEYEIVLAQNRYRAFIADFERSKAEKMLAEQEAAQQEQARYARESAARADAEEFQRRAIIGGMLMNNMQQTQRNAVDIGIASGYQQAIIGSRAPLLINPMPTNYNGVVPIQRFNRF